MSKVNLSRRGFLRGRVVPAVVPVRPPWSLEEGAFLAACTRCGDCVPVCPTAILVISEGRPQVDFRRGECTFCGKCVEACKPQALRRDGEAQPPWRLRAEVADSCLPHTGVECRVCGEQCAARAIRFSPRVGGPPVPEIQLAACTGCGACVAPCPVTAIRVR